MPGPFRLDTLDNRLTLVTRALGKMASYWGYAEADSAIQDAVRQVHGMRGAHS